MANFETLKDEKKQNQSAANAGENLIAPSSRKNSWAASLYKKRCSFLGAALFV